MKKTLFLTAILSLISMSAYAEYTADVFLPQSIITVQQGEKADRNTALTDENYRSSTDEDSTTMGEVLTQAQQYTANYSKRSAIVKDGQGELVISGAEGEKREAIAMSAPLLVREGTLSLSNVSITNTPKTDGSNLAVGGINANLVLDNAAYLTGDNASPSSSIIVGGVDGDGTLTLKNKSKLTAKHDIYLGSDSQVPFKAPADPSWDMNPHRGGSYVTTDSVDNERYRTATNAAGFQNSNVSSGGTMRSTATVNVLSGSKMTANYSLYIENATLNIDGDGSQVIMGVDESANNEYIGNGYGTKSVVNITNGGLMESYNTYFMVSSNSKVWGSDSRINIIGTNSLLSVQNYALLGYFANDVDSTAVVTLAAGGKMYATYLYVGSGNNVGCKDSITLTEESVLQAQVTHMYKGSIIDTDATSTLVMYRTHLHSGSALINRGELSHYIDEDGAYDSYTYLYGGSRLQTGELLISGCEGLVAEGHELETNYDNTGLGEKMSLVTAYAGGVNTDTGTITLGALLTGKNEMQFLSSSDLQSINESVLARLAITGTETYTIAYKHEIGKNICVNYTTDDLNNVTGKESIAVTGGAILVEQGEGEHHVGTIGSYVNAATETKAAIAVHEQTSGSTVTWKGTELQTVAGEKAVIAEDNQVNVEFEPAGTEEIGKLTVVTSSELLVAGSVKADAISVKNGGRLTNNGTLNASVTVEGVLNGSGTINGDVTLKATGELTVGNSPGYQKVYDGDVNLTAGSNTVFCIAGKTASSEGNTGWTSGTASQICIANGALTLDADANVTIEFGGAAMINDGMFGQNQKFCVTLVEGGCDALEDHQLTSLLAHTTFVLTSDAEGLTGLAVPESGVISVSGAQYEIKGSNLVLTGTMTYTPEPTTATLSLLALAGLAARRRRRE